MVGENIFLFFFLSFYIIISQNYMFVVTELFLLLSLSQVTNQFKRSLYFSM